jgi:hypothetical protein
MEETWDSYRILLGKNNFDRGYLENKELNWEITLK